MAIEVNEGLKLKTTWQIIKWKDPKNKIAKALQNGLSTEEALKIFKDYIIDVETFEGNVALNEGIQLLLDIISGIDTTSNKWDSTNAKCGVGDGTTAEDASQTGLQGTNKTYKAMDSGYPQRSGQTLEFRSTYGSTEGNHGWQEFTVTNDTDDTGTNLNRKVADKGTKTSGESWTLSLKITGS